MNNFFSGCLAVAFLLTNTLCLCDARASEISTPSVHDMHEMHSAQTVNEHHQPAQADCDHTDCANDCFDEVTLTDKRVIQSEIRLLLDIEDDDGQVIDEVPGAIKYRRAASTGPPGSFLLVAAATPISRHDLLLE